MTGLASNWYDTLTDDIKKKFKDVNCHNIPGTFPVKREHIFKPSKLENVKYDNKCDKPIEQYIESHD